VPRKEEIPKGKRPVTVYISEDLYKAIVEVAVQRYGQVKGALSRFAEEAFREALSLHKHTSAQLNPKLRIRDVYDAVVKRIVETLGYRPVEVTEDILDRAIGEVRGTDYRTTEKWKQLFVKAGLIKYLGGFPPKRIYELL
jgi:hypothetical protein